MFGNAAGGSGGGDAGYGFQHGHQTRSRGRGRQEGLEERFVEGDLFGSSKRPSFRSSDPPQGKPARATHYDATALNTFRNGGGGGGYDQNPTAQPSPFARQPAQPNGFVTGARATMGETGGAYGGGYGQPNGGAGARRDFGSSAGFDSSVALVPVEPNGGSRPGGVMDDDDDDDMPTRSLADSIDVGDGGVGAGGLRQRRGSGGGRMGGGMDAGFARREEPDAQRATWVVVWGVPSGKANDVLTCFLRFGHIEEQRGRPDSNWIYFKYATRLQADKALASGHGSRLTDTVMLGVQAVVDDEVWQALREGRIPPLATAQPLLAKTTPGRPSARTPTAQGSSGEALEIDDTDLLGAPPQRPRGEQSVCGKVMAFFGFY